MAHVGNFVSLESLASMWRLRSGQPASSTWMHSSWNDVILKDIVFFILYDITLYSRIVYYVVLHHSI